MIALWSDCLLFQLSSGESVPSSAEMISFEMMGEAPGKFDPEIVRHAAAAVFHYFKHELGRKTVLVAEFAEAVEKVLRGLGFSISSEESAPAHTVVKADLGRLAGESGASLELFFYPRLRGELRAQLLQSPRLVRFRGLRGCVKQLAGARRWGPRCENLQDQIVEFLRQCLSVELRETECALVVE